MGMRNVVGGGGRKGISGEKIKRKKKIKRGSFVILLTIKIIFLN